MQRIITEMDVLPNVITQFHVQCIEEFISTDNHGGCGLCIQRESFGDTVEAARQ